MPEDLFSTKQPSVLKNKADFRVFTNSLLTPVMLRELEGMWTQVIKTVTLIDLCHCFDDLQLYCKGLGLDLRYDDLNYLFVFILGFGFTIKY